MDILSKAKFNMSSYQIPSLPQGSEIKSIFGELLSGIPSLVHTTVAVGNAERRVSRLTLSPTRRDLFVISSKNLGALAIAKRKKWVKNCTEYFRVNKLKALTHDSNCT